MGMSGNVVSFQVDDELYGYLQQKDNQSAYLRRLVRADMKGSDVDLVGLQLQIETLEQQAQSHAEQEEMYQQRAEELREKLEQAQSKTDLTLQEARNALENTPKDPTNEAVKHWAEKIGITPETLCEKLR